MALAARRAIGDSVLAGNSLFDLGTTQYRLGRFEAAESLYLQSARVREGTGEKAKLGSTRSLLGMTQLELGRPLDAVASARSGLALLHELEGEPARTAQAWANLGTVLVQADSLAAADEVLAEGESFAEAAGALDALAAIEMHRARLARERGRYSEALLYLRAARDIREGLGREADIIETLGEIGLVHAGVGDAQRARRALNEALGRADSLGSPALRIPVLINLALTERLDRSYERAERLAREALGLATAAGDSARAEKAANELAEVALAAGRPGDALDLQRRALATRSHRSPGDELHLRLNAAVSRLRMGDTLSARREFEELLRRCEAEGRLELSSYALINLADIAERAGRWTEAIALSRRALAAVESLRAGQGAENEAIRLLADRHDEFRWFIHLLSRLDEREPGRGYGEEAFAVAERVRARALGDRIAVRGAARPLNATIRLRDAQSALGAKEALLTYSLGDSASVLWVVRRDRWRRFSLPAEPALRLRVEAALRRIAQGRTGSDAREHRALRELYAVLVAPAESLLADARLLYVEPDGALHRLPFEALVRVPAAGEARKPARYLVERWAVAYLPAAAWLARENRSLAQGPAFIVGDVRYSDAPGAEALAGRGEATEGDDERGPPRRNLPATAEEVASLSARLAPPGYFLLRGVHASRERLLAAQPAIEQAWLIHFATHAEANPAEPGASCLWLAPDSGAAEPSRLDATEIGRLNLSAQLVALSACETAAGPVELGEGVLGLAREFLGAGAGSVMVTLWKVADRPTARLTSEFYGLALGGGQSRAEALARAKRAMIASTVSNEPLHWSPMILIGDPGPLQPPPSDDPAR
jgi:CHAT domain-containing protein